MFSSLKQINGFHDKLLNILKLNHINTTYEIKIIFILFVCTSFSRIKFKI